MLWELAEYIKKKITMTVIPALRNLFSSKKSLAGMLLVMLILQVLLSVVCITGIENIKNQQHILGEYTSLISSSTIADETKDSFLSDNFRVAFDSTSIFVGALIVWGVCALTAYQKVTFASADRDKYVWGMYVTHGAKIKKIRGMLKYALYTPHLVATAIGYPTALALCNYAFRQHGYTYSFSWLSLIVVLILSYVCIRLVVEYQCLLIRRMSCVQMLKEEDAPKSVCFPRRHSKLIRGFTPSRYGSVTFIRMRKYYISLAAIAAVPAVIWICFHVSAKGEDNYLSSEINEFTVNISSGISEDKLNSIENTNLKKINGVNSVKAGAFYPSSKIYTHLLLDGSYFNDTAKTPHHTDLYADNTLTLCCDDTAFRHYIGYNARRLRDGYVTIVTTSDGEYAYQEGDKIWLAVSKLNGSVRVVDEGDMELLGNEARDCEYVALSVASVEQLRRGELSADGFYNPDGTYFLLTPADYKKITSISPDSYSCEVEASRLSYTATLDQKGSFTLTADRSLFSVLPSEGDCLEVKGSFKATATLTEITENGVAPQTWTVPIEQEFDYLYINQVSVSGNTVTMSVSPYCIVTVHDGLFWDVLLAFGTPDLPSSQRSYFASSCGSRLVLTGTAVTISGDIATVHTSSAVSAAEAGSHALVTTDVLKNTNGRLLLEKLYADCSFTVACADKRTTSALGLEIPHVKSGSAILVLPASGFHNYALSIGDKLRIAITKENVANYSADSIITSSDYDMLTQMLDMNVYDYVLCNVAEIILVDDVNEPYIFLNTEDFCAVIHKQAPYTTFDIIISSGIESGDYAKLRDEISEWAAGNKLSPTVISKGAYVEYLLRRNANYSTIMMLIGMLIPLIIPFIWYYPISTLFDRRRTELSLLRAFGKKRSQIFRGFALEGILVSVSAFLSIIVLCYPAMFIFKLICNWCKLPLAFEYSDLTLAVLLVAATFSALCAAVSFVVCYIATVPKKMGAPK